MALNPKNAVSAFLSSLFVFFPGCKEPKKEAPAFPVISVYVNEEISKEDTYGFLQKEEKVRLPIEIHFRGSTSLVYSKKSYNLSFKDSSVSLLGLTASKKWVLYAPYADKTALRNKLAYGLFNNMGNPGAESKYAELYINDDYRGLYELIQKQEEVLISRYKAPFYLIKIDKRSGESNFHWRSGNSENLGFEVHYPRFKKISGEDTSYIINKVDTLENILLHTPEKLNQIADDHSFIDFLLLQELCKNPDGYRSSVYFFIDPAGKIHMGPFWDCDLAFGNSFLNNANYEEGWRFDEKKDNPFAENKIPLWWKRLYENKVMHEKIKDRWLVLRKELINPDKINRRIDSLANEIKSAQSRDQDKWKTLGKPLKWNVYLGNSYAEEVEYLKNWIRVRIDWIDKQIIKGN